MGQKSIMDVFFGTRRKRATRRALKKKQTGRREKKKGKGNALNRAEWKTTPTDRWKAEQKKRR